MARRENETDDDHPSSPRKNRPLALWQKRGGGLPMRERRGHDHWTAWSIGAPKAEAVTEKIKPSPICTNLHQAPKAAESP
jgi:hypothetical protein